MMTIYQRFTFIQPLLAHVAIAMSLSFVVFPYLAAEQFIFYDKICVYQAPHGSHTFDWFQRGPDWPQSWIAPINYRDGRMYTRFEVLEHDEINDYGVGINWFVVAHGKKHKVGQREWKIRLGSVFEFDHKPNQYHDNLGAEWDWASPVTNGFVALLMQESKNAPMKPIIVHGIAVVVSEGGTYVPQISWKSLPWKIKYFTDISALIKKEQLGIALTAAEKYSSSLKGKKDTESEEKNRARTEQVLEAEMIVDVLKQSFEQRFKSYQVLKATNPTLAIKLATDFSRLYAPSPIVATLAREVAQWQKDPVVQHEIQAQMIYANLEKAATRLHAKRIATKANELALVKPCTADLLIIKQTAQTLRKQAPQSISAQNATKVAAEFGITLD